MSEEPDMTAYVIGFLFGFVLLIVAIALAV